MMASAPCSASSASAGAAQPETSVAIESAARSARRDGTVEGRAVRSERMAWILARVMPASRLRNSMLFRPRGGRSGCCGILGTGPATQGDAESQRDERAGVEGHALLHAALFFRV